MGLLNSGCKTCSDPLFCSTRSISDLPVLEAWSHTGKKQISDTYKALLFWIVYLELWPAYVPCVDFVSAVPSSSC